MARWYHQKALDRQGGDCDPQSPLLLVFRAPYFCRSLGIGQIRTSLNKGVRADQCALQRFFTGSGLCSSAFCPCLRRALPGSPLLSACRCRSLSRCTSCRWLPAPCRPASRSRCCGAAFGARLCGAGFPPRPGLCSLSLRHGLPPVVDWWAILAGTYKIKIDKTIIGGGKCQGTIEDILPAHHD